MITWAGSTLGLIINGSCIKSASGRNTFTRLLGVLVLAACSGRAAAQAPPADSSNDRESPYRYRSLPRDIKDYATAPIHWDEGDWIYFGAELAAVAAAHGFDETVRKHLTAGQTTPLDGKDPHSVSDALPAAVVVGVTFFYAWNIDNDAGRGETWSMLEAAGLGSATSYVLKYAAGRQAPNETTNDNVFRKGGSSFPSLHVTFATAIGTVLAESGNDDYRWIRRIFGVWNGGWHRVPAPEAQSALGLGRGRGRRGGRRKRKLRAESRAPHRSRLENQRYSSFRGRNALV